MGLNNGLSVFILLFILKEKVKIIICRKNGAVIQLEKGIKNI